MRVLITDNHYLLCDTLVMFLEGEGCIETASTGTFREASAHIESDEPCDLISFDYNMPGKNGLEGLCKTTALRDAPWLALISVGPLARLLKMRLQPALRDVCPNSY
jgi:two-component system nitrate/nitrite response regulator NarL